MGVGITNPNQQLEVVGATDTDIVRFRGLNSGVRFQSNTGSMDIVSINSSDSVQRNLLIRQYGQSVGILLDTNNNVIIGATSATGTASQPLQVTGGAYVSGSLGIGNANPTFKLDVTATSDFARFRTFLSGGTPFITIANAKGTAASPIANANGDLWGLNFEAYDGTNSIPGVRIFAKVDGSVSTGSVPQSLNFYTGSSGGGSLRAIIDSSGNLIPGADNTYNLGSTSARWANIYSADLQLSNEGSQNDVDGTWGNYTIQEGENDLFLINRRTGKKYKFLLEEVK